MGNCISSTANSTGKQGQRVPLPKAQANSQHKPEQPTDTTQPTDTDVLVIGAGWAGCSAAYHLHKEYGIDVQVVEAGHHYGGRAYSFPYVAPDGKTYYYEHGAQFIGESQPTIMRIVDEMSKLHPEIYRIDGFQARKPYPEQVMILAQKRRYVYSREQGLFGNGGLPPNISFLDALSMQLLIFLVQHVERSINTLEPWNSPDWVLEYDKMTMDEFFNKPYVTPNALAIVTVAIEAPLSVEMREVSALYYLWYCACNGGIMQECNDENHGPQQYFVSTGMDNVLKALVETEPALPPRIHFGTRVESVRQGGPDDPVRVTTRKVDPTTGEGVGPTTVTAAKKVVVATSPLTMSRQTNGIAFDPPLPAGRLALNSQVGGRTLKCTIWYKTAWWRHSNGRVFSGYMGAKGNDVLWIMDYSTPEQPSPDATKAQCAALMTFTVADKLQEFLDRHGGAPDKDDVKLFITKSIAFQFGDERALSDSEEYVDISYFLWHPEEVYCGVGPNTVMGPGVLTAHGPSLNEPFVNVHFASSENARKLHPDKKATDGKLHRTWWPPKGGILSQDDGDYSDYRQSVGYMDGAFLSGEHTAHDIAVELGKATSISPLYTVSNEQPSKQPAAAERGAATAEQVKWFMEAIVWQLYLGVRPQISTWENRQWQNDNSKALQNRLLLWLDLALLWSKILSPSHQLQLDQVLGAAGAAVHGAQQLLAADKGTEYQKEVQTLCDVAGSLMALLSIEPSGAEPDDDGDDHSAEHGAHVPDQFKQFVKDNASKTSSALAGAGVAASSTSK